MFLTSIGINKKLVAKIMCDRVQGPKGEGRKRKKEADKVDTICGREVSDCTMDKPTYHAISPQFKLNPLEPFGVF